MENEKLTVLPLKVAISSKQSCKLNETRTVFVLSDSKQGLELHYLLCWVSTRSAADLSGFHCRSCL